MWEKLRRTQASIEIKRPRLPGVARSPDPPVISQIDDTGVTRVKDDVLLVRMGGCVVACNLLPVLTAVMSPIKVLSANEDSLVVEWIDRDT